MEVRVHDTHLDAQPGMLRCVHYASAVQSMAWQQVQGPGRGTSSGSRPLLPRMEKLRLSMRSTWTAGTAGAAGAAAGWRDGQQAPTQ